MGSWWIVIVIALIYLFWARRKHRHKTKRSAKYSDFDDVIRGYRFCATLQLRTPLHILEQHHRFHKGAREPSLECSMADGCWVPETKSWGELGIKGLRELPEGTIASDIGQIPESGGGYLAFLKAFRKIFESNMTLDQKCTEICKLPNHSSQFAEYYAKHPQLQPERLPKFLYQLQIQELLAYEQDEDLAYALQISEVLPTIKKLDSLASRYNTAHRGAGGRGLLSAQNSNHYEEIKKDLQDQYLERFIELCDQHVQKAGASASQRKTSRGKIGAWLRVKEQITSGATEFQYPLPGIEMAVEGFENKINEEIACVEAEQRK